jgi:hypothetical protein
MERHKKNRKKNHKILEEEDRIIKMKNMKGGKKNFEEKTNLKAHEHRSDGRAWNI